MTESVRLQSSAPRAIGHPDGDARGPAVRRRGVLGLLAVGAATFVRPPGPRPGSQVVVGHTQLPSPNTTWRAFAITPTRAVLLMQNLPRTGLAARDGASGGAVQLASTTVRTGTARLTVPMASGSTRAVRVEDLGFSLPVTLSTTSAALAGSPWILVNKRNPLSSGFVPTGLVTVEGVQLRSTVAQSYSQFKAAASASGHSLRLKSGYRSYASQAALYNQDVARYGRAGADQRTARAGYSEHQTGLALDLAISAGTSVATWVAANSHRFGFVVRYETGQQAVTGYQYEPWHLRHVGTTLAGQYRAWGMRSLEAMLGLPAAPTY